MLSRFLGNCTSILRFIQINILQHAESGMINMYYKYVGSKKSIYFNETLPTLTSNEFLLHVLLSYKHPNVTAKIET